MYSRRLLIATVVALLGSSTVCALEPVASETREIQPITDESKTLAVLNGMIFYDTPGLFGLQPSRGIRFPPGIYVLEAEDKEYQYFRSASPLEFRAFKDKKVVEDKEMPGGIMLGKSNLKLVPAGGYIDGEGSTKVLVWKLGGEFVGLKNREWKKSF